MAGKCCPCSHNSSLNIFILVIVSGGVYLSQIDVGFNVLDLSVVDIYSRVIFHYHLCLRRVHLQLLMVFHISAYYIRCLLSQFCTISRRFVFTARDGDDSLNFSGLLVALATLDVPCWNMSVIVSLMLSMSSGSCSVSNLLTLFEWHLLLVASWS